jgi:ribosomal protein L31
MNRKKRMGVSSLHCRQRDIIEAVECYICYCDITADSHPAYPDERGLLDTAGRIEKFNQRIALVWKETL